MNCPQARFLLYAYVDRELPRKDSEALDRHLASCPACERRADSARQVVRLLRSRLGYARAPITLMERISSGEAPRVRARVLPLGLAASILLLILPLVTDEFGPRAAMSLASSVAVAAPRSVVPVSKKMTGTFVCLHCEAGVPHAGTCPVTDERVDELGFCADNGETWRVITKDPAFTRAAVGETVTVEGIAFPESGFLRASRVGY